MGIPWNYRRPAGYGSYPYSRGPYGYSTPGWMRQLNRLPSVDSSLRDEATDKWIAQHFADLPQDKQGRFIGFAATEGGYDLSSYLRGLRPFDIGLCLAGTLYLKLPDSLNAEDRFSLVEKMILAAHRKGKSDSKWRKGIRINATFDDWHSKEHDATKEVHDGVVAYYSDLDFLQRYGLDKIPWCGDKDIRALLDVLQARGRAKAASKLEKLEREIEAISGQISKLQSGGRYYRQDSISLSADFDCLHVSIFVENDRGRKRQDTIEKVAAAPFKAAEKAYVGAQIGCATIFFLGMVIGVPILLILALFGVIK